MYRIVFYQRGESWEFEVFNFVRPDHLAGMVKGE